MNVLQNIGNSTYVNAILQCLIHTHKIYKLVGLRDIDNDQLQVSSLGHLELSNEKETHDKELYNNLCEFFESQQKDLDWQLKRFLKSLYKLGESSFKPDRECDAAIFLRLIVENLQRNDIGRIKDGLMSIITDEIYDCQNCGKKKECNSIREYILTLRVDQVYNIEDAISVYMNGDIINEYRCEKCRIVGGLNRKRTFRQLPKLLVIQLSRFDVSIFRILKILIFMIIKH